ncbi:MAG: aldehyde dehydrogenase family protein, partial [Acidimicrobiia bacterium]|nr:aldehyde dehydrogenase family protein [Acidimicrobiia bacterium]
MYRRELFIGGRWATPAGTRRAVISPATEEPVGEVPEATTADIDAAVGAARDAFDTGPWPDTEPAERAEVLERTASILRKRADEIAGITVEEMGCAAGQAPKAQTGMLGPVFEYYAELIRSFEFARRVRTPDGRAGMVTSLPVGVVGAIVPWN